MLRLMLAQSIAILAAFVVAVSCAPPADPREPAQPAAVPQAQPVAAAVAQPSPGPFQILGSAFVAISVADADASAAWYAKTLGLELKRSIDTPDGRIAIRILARQGLMVELIAQRGSLALDQLAGPDGPLQKRIFVQGHFKAGFFVADAQAVYDHLRALSVSMDERVIVDNDMNLEFFVFRDPDGNRLQVFERIDGNPAPGPG